MRMSVDTQGFDDFIADVEAMAERAVNLQPVLEVVAADLQHLSRQAIESSTGIGGESFPSLSTVTRSLRTRKGIAGAGKPLEALAQSIRGTATALSAEVSTGFQWAEIHQKGSSNLRVFGSKSTHNLPARPFLPIGRDGKTYLPEAVETKFESNLFAYVYLNQNPEGGTE